MNDERAIESGDRPYKLRGKWVTIRSFGTAEQAHLVKLLLDRAGIPCYVDNEHTGTALWHVQPAVGGIKLRVPAPFEQQAREVIESRGQSIEDEDDEEDEREFPDESNETDEENLYESDEDEEDDATSGQSCPACHSNDITSFGWTRRIGQALLVLTLGALADIIHPALLALTAGWAVYLLITKPDYRCLRCGKQWVAGRDA